MNDVLTLDPRRRPGRAALPAHPHALEAGGADRRQVPAHRHPDQQLPARRPQADLRADAVQLGVAQPAHRADLSPRRVLRRLRRGARGRADARQLRLVPGHRRRRAAGGAALRRIRRRLLPDPRRRSPLPDGLLRADRVAHRERAPTSPSPRSRSRPPTRPRWASSGSTIDGQIAGFEEKPTAARLAEMGSSIPRGSTAGGDTADKPFVASMGIYVFSREVLLEIARAAGHRLRQGDHPAGARHAPRATRTSSAATGRTSAPSTAFYDANIQLTQPRRAVQFLPPAAGRSTRTRGSCPARARYNCRIDDVDRRRRAATSIGCEIARVGGRHPHARRAPARASRGRCCSAPTTTRRRPAAERHPARHRPRRRARSRDRRQERAHRRRRAARQRARASSTPTATATSSATASSSSRRGQWSATGVAVMTLGSARNPA